MFTSLYDELTVARRTVEDESTFPWHAILLVDVLGVKECVADRNQFFLHLGI
jgi:hypothetical protein